MYLGVKNHILGPTSISDKSGSFSDVLLKSTFVQTTEKKVFRFELGSELESNWQGILINFHTDMGNIFKNALLGFGM